MTHLSIDQGRWLARKLDVPAWQAGQLLATLKAQREALSVLVQVCAGMDADVQAERPTEAMYQAAMTKAQMALGAPFATCDARGKWFAVIEGTAHGPQKDRAAAVAYCVARSG